MADENDKRRDSRQEKASRDDRLKSALRENLKRRKLQARERSKMTDPSTGDEASLHGQVGKRSD